MKEIVFFVVKNKEHLVYDLRRLRPVADPDFELRWGPGFGLLVLPAFVPSVISSFFTQNKGGRAPWAPPLDPPLKTDL